MWNWINCCKKVVFLPSLLQKARLIRRKLLLEFADIHWLAHGKFSKGMLEPAWPPYSSKRLIGKGQQPKLGSFFYICLYGLVTLAFKNGEIWWRFVIHSGGIGRISRLAGLKNSAIYHAFKVILLITSTQEQCIKIKNNASRNVIFNKFKYKL